MEKLEAKGERLPPFGLNWGPSRDGNLLPYQLFSQEALQLSKNIPLLIGTTKNEFMPSLVEVDGFTQMGRLQCKKRNYYVF